MRHTNLLLLVVITMLSCEQNKKKTGVKPDERPKHIAYFDTLHKIFYDYSYKLAFDTPNHWLWDYGVAGRKVFRAYQPDSAISFIIDIRRLKKPVTLDLWETYENEQKHMKLRLKNMFSELSNAPMEDLILEKVYVKNKKGIRGAFQYQAHEVGFTYDNTLLLHQVLIDEALYNFGLHVPTMFYEQDIAFYNNLISNVSFFSSNEEMPAPPSLKHRKGSPQNERIIPQ